MTERINTRTPYRHATIKAYFQKKDCSAGPFFYYYDRAAGAEPVLVGASANHMGACMHADNRQGIDEELERLRVLSIASDPLWSTEFAALCASARDEIKGRHHWSVTCCVFGIDLATANTARRFVLSAVPCVGYSGTNNVHLTHCLKSMTICTVSQINDNVHRLTMGIACVLPQRRV